MEWIGRFVHVWFAWALFCSALLTLVKEAHTFVTTGKNTLKKRDWGVLVRWAYVASCLTIWYLTLFE